jgi:hypothetical protein
MFILKWGIPILNDNKGIMEYKSILMPIVKGFRGGNETTNK